MKAIVVLNLAATASAAFTAVVTVGAAGSFEEDPDITCPSGTEPVEVQRTASTPLSELPQLVLDFSTCSASTCSTTGRRLDGWNCVQWCNVASSATVVTEDLANALGYEFVNNPTSWDDLLDALSTSPWSALVDVEESLGYYYADVEAALYQLFASALGVLSSDISSAAVVDGAVVVDFKTTTCVAAGTCSAAGAQATQSVETASLSFCDMLGAGSAFLASIVSNLPDGFSPIDESMSLGYDCDAPGTTISSLDDLASWMVENLSWDGDGEAVMAVADLRMALYIVIASVKGVLPSDVLSVTVVDDGLVAEVYETSCAVGTSSSPPAPATAECEDKQGKKKCKKLKKKNKCSGAKGKKHCAKTCDRCEEEEEQQEASPPPPVVVDCEAFDKKKTCKKAHSCKWVKKTKDCQED